MTPRLSGQAGSPVLDNAAVTARFAQFRISSRITVGIRLITRNRPGLSEAIWFGSRRHCRLFQHGVVAFLGFGRRDVVDGLQEPPVPCTTPTRICKSKE